MNNILLFALLTAFVVANTEEHDGNRESKPYGQDQLLGVLQALLDITKKSQIVRNINHHWQHRQGHVEKRYTPKNIVLSTLPPVKTVSSTTQLPPAVTVPIGLNPFGPYDPKNSGSFSLNTLESSDPKRLGPYGSGTFKSSDPLVSRPYATWNLEPSASRVLGPYNNRIAGSFAGASGSERTGPYGTNNFVPSGLETSAALHLNNAIPSAATTLIPVDNKTAPVSTSDALPGTHALVSTNIKTLAPSSSKISSPYGLLKPPGTYGTRANTETQPLRNFLGNAALGQHLNPFPAYSATNPVFPPYTRPNQMPLPAYAMPLYQNQPLPRRAAPLLTLPMMPHHLSPGRWPVGSSFVPWAYWTKQLRRKKRFFVGQFKKLKRHKRDLRCANQNERLALLRIKGGVAQIREQLNDLDLENRAGGSFRRKKRDTDVGNVMNNINRGKKPPLSMGDRVSLLRIKAATDLMQQALIDLDMSRFDLQGAQSSPSPTKRLKRDVKGTLHNARGKRMETKWHPSYDKRKLIGDRKLRLWKKRHHYHNYDGHYAISPYQHRYPTHKKSSKIKTWQKQERRWFTKLLKKEKLYRKRNSRSQGNDTYNGHGHGNQSAIINSNHTIHLNDKHKLFGNQTYLKGNQPLPRLQTSDSFSVNPQTKSDTMQRMKYLAHHNRKHFYKKTLDLASLLMALKQNINAMNNKLNKGTKSIDNLETDHFNMKSTDIDVARDNMEKLRLEINDSLKSLASNVSVLLQSQQHLGQTVVQTIDSVLRSLKDMVHIVDGEARIKPVTMVTDGIMRPTTQTIFSQGHVTQQQITQNHTLQPVTKLSVSNKSFTKQPASNQSITKQTVTNQPITKQAVTNQSITKQPVTNKLVTKQPATNQLVTKQLVAQQPVTKQVTQQQITQMSTMQNQARLEQARLEQARLQQARQEKARLEQARLEQARLKQARIYNTLLPKPTITPRSHLTTRTIIIEHIPGEKLAVNVSVIKSPGVKKYKQGQPLGSQSNAKRRFTMGRFQGRTLSASQARRSRSNKAKVISGLKTHKKQKHLSHGFGYFGKRALKRMSGDRLRGIMHLDGKKHNLDRERKSKRGIGNSVRKKSFGNDKRIYNRATRNSVKKKHFLGKDQITKRKTRKANRNKQFLGGIHLTVRGIRKSNRKDQFFGGGRLPKHGSSNSERKKRSLCRGCLLSHGTMNSDRKKKTLCRECFSKRGTVNIDRKKQCKCVNIFSKRGTSYSDRQKRCKCSSEAPQRGPSSSDMTPMQGEHLLTKVESRDSDRGKRLLHRGHETKVGSGESDRQKRFLVDMSKLSILNWQHLTPFQPEHRKQGHQEGLDTDNILP